MAYRRRQGITRASTFKEEIYQDDSANEKKVPTFTSSYSFSPSSSSSSSSPSSSSSSSLAAQAIRASAAHRESSLSSAYGGDSAFASDRLRSKGFSAYEDAMEKNDPKGFWGILARKAKAILDDDDANQQYETRSQAFDPLTDGQFQPSSYQSLDSLRKVENPTLRKGLNKLTSSLNQIGDTFEKAFEEGRTIVENKTADIIQETRKLQIRRKGSSPESHSQASGANIAWRQPMMQPMEPNTQTTHANQLKASRDVAMATAAKAKLLLRELKTVKADLAFAKERCAQLEEENKILRESREKGGNPADDDLIRLQLETLLAEKARLAHENSVYARENRFLREIVEYHQLTMQDVVYLDEGTEEVTEVYPISIPSVSQMLSITPEPTSPPSPSEIPPSVSSPLAKEVYPAPSSPQEKDVPQNDDVTVSSGTSTPKEEDGKRPSISSA